ncbi:MAG: hypothetical protein VXZ27_10805 [SAR324 cluster bacterium]|nr:hypothetical protein [SAR324 cluster bacterium]MEC8544802.1 hypothetical protein [SAR324 cluster bacterium]
MTYGQVAQCIGEGTARLVGMALSSLPTGSKLLPAFTLAVYAPFFFSPSYGVP